MGIKVKIIDANIILRILLNDNPVQAVKALNIIKENIVFIKNEVLAEVIYILRRVYQKDKNQICDFISSFIQDNRVITESNAIIMLALDTYKNKNIDFVDCLLYAYSKIFDYEVYTFDKKLNKLLKDNI
ncbi:MAG: PIN domain-containing protein [Oscillospiraceae bacterium]|nr:PIN domain-containing protein [Oscillospiraceae bacterium]